MPELFNPSQFPVYVAELGKQLAPYETIAVDDAETVARAVATGVLKPDASEFEAVIKRNVEAEAAKLGTDASELEARVRQGFADDVAKWHDEHSAPAEQVAKADEVCAAPKAKADESPAEDAGEAQEAPEAAQTAPVVQRQVTDQGVEINSGLPTEVRSEGDPA